MSQEILPPVFPWAPDDLAVFPSLAEASSWLEPIDAADGRTRVWDSTGLPLAVRVEGRISRGRFWVDQTGARAVIDEGPPRGPDAVPTEVLQYALWCRSAAGSLRAAREQLADWFRREGVANVELVAIKGGTRRLARGERRIGAGMAKGDVLVRPFFVAFRRDLSQARAVALGLIDEIVLREWWQFWR